MTAPCEWCDTNHDPRVMRAAATIEKSYGRTVVVSIPGLGSWHVPRAYVAIHGLVGEMLPLLAQRYGWEAV